MNIWVEHIPNTTFDWNSEKNAFKRAMSKVRQFKSNAAGGKFIEYHGEVTRFEDDDAFTFYSQHSIVYSHPNSFRRFNCVNITACFDFSRMVIIIRRTAFTAEPAKKTNFKCSSTPQ